MKLSLRHEQINMFDGQASFKLLHISDIHLRFSASVLETIKIVITNRDPDLILLTGDYYDLPKGARMIRKFLQQVSQHYRVVFIRGNHDNFYGPKVSNLLFNIPNCTCAENSLITFPIGGHQVNITSWQNRDELPEGKNFRNIVLIHNPEKIRVNELHKIDLILAGHLHGGQFRFLQMKNKSYFPGNLLYKYCIDRKQIDRTTLIVSKGLGDTFPFRFNCSKEVVEIKLV